MEKNRNKILSISAIILGFILCLIYLYNYFFIDYFSSIGLAESTSTFGFSLLLIIAGFINLRNLDLGRSLLWSFVVGSIIERVIVYLLYQENISMDILILPIIASAIIGGLLYFSKVKKEYNKGYQTISVVIISLITLLPKVIF